MLNPFNAEMREVVARLAMNSDFRRLLGWLDGEREQLRDRLEMTDHPEARGAAKALKDLRSEIERLRTRNGHESNKNKSF